MSTQKFARSRIVSVNDAGMVIGQDHHRARFTDHDIDLIRELRADGMKLSDIADKFETSKGRVHDICAARSRGQTATSQRTLGAPRRRFRPASVHEFQYVTDLDAE